MAINQIVPVYITLQGDGTSTTFTYALSNLYQQGFGGSIPFGSSGIVPSEVNITNTTPPIDSGGDTASVDANGNVTLTFSTAPLSGVTYQVEMDLLYTSGAAVSTSPTQSSNVSIVSSTTTVPITGGAAPVNASVIGGTYNFPRISLTSGQSAGLSLDNDGSLLVQVADPIATGTNTIGNVVLTSAGGVKSGVFAGGRLNVSLEPSQLFVDTFDTFDTVNRWLLPVSKGGGVVSTVSAGNLTLGTGTATGGYSYLQSVPNFPPAVPSYLTAQFVIALEAYLTLSNTYRFWGFGIPTSAPTIANPFSNAIGYELYTDGKLYAVVYSGGVRTVIQDLSPGSGNSYQPVDTLFHRYSLAWRSDKQFFMIDSSDPAATGGSVMPQVQTLPIILLTIAGTSPSSSGVLTVASVGVGDSGTNNITLSDSTYGWRGATIDTSGNLLVQMTDMVNLMSRLLKLMESNATVDASNRQRIAVEAMPTVTANATLQAGANLVGTVGTAQTINTANGNPYAVAAANVQSVQEGPVDQRWRIVHEARNAYANGIRNKLTFS